MNPKMSLNQSPNTLDPNSVIQNCFTFFIQFISVLDYFLLKITFNVYYAFTSCHYFDNFFCIVLQMKFNVSNIDRRSVNSETINKRNKNKIKLSEFIVKISIVQ